jgi:uncharacterized protein (DUF2147 family)
MAQRFHRPRSVYSLLPSDIHTGAGTSLHKFALLLCNTGPIWRILMTLRFGLIATILITLNLSSGAFAQESGDPTGTWLTQAGDAKVQVSRCGTGICGVVVWLRDPTDPNTGKPAVDDKNPNPALRRRPMIGLPLFNGMQPSGVSRWAGRIYNADDGGTYDSNIAMMGPNSLRVNGCVGGLCGGENWTRSKR